MMVSVAGGNSKCGACVATTSRQLDETCPPCALAEVCYGARGRVRMVSGMIARGDPVRLAPLDDPLSKADGVPLIRHHVVGDMFTRTGKSRRRLVDAAYVRYLADWHRRPSQRWSIGWTYTHGAQQLTRAGFGPEFWPDRLTVLASCETLAQAHKLQAMGWSTARVIPQPEDRERGEVLCPYDLAKHQRVKPSVSCSSCRLCFDGSRRNIAFIQF
jgi:hypothetical protein